MAPRLPAPSDLPGEILSPASGAGAVEPVPSADRHPVALYLGSLAEGSRRTMRGALDLVARRLSGARWHREGDSGPWKLSGGQADILSLHWHNIRQPHLQVLRAELAERFSPSTVKKTLAAVKGVLNQCWQLGLIDAEEHQRARSVKGVKGERLMRGRALDLGEIRGLAEACKRLPHRSTSTRDGAIIAVLFCCGLRRSELVKLQVGDYDPETGALAVRAAKGNKDRTVYLTNGSKDALDDWISERGREPGPLFCPLTKGGTVRLQALCDQAVLYVLQRRGAEAGVKPFTPHDLRRTCASELWDAGVDGSTIQKLLGHESQTTTARYDRRGERAKQQAAKALNFPW